MNVKIEWPDGSQHIYATDHAGLQRIANYLADMYVAGELELIHRVQAPEGDSTPIEGAGDLQCATIEGEAIEVFVEDRDQQYDLDNTRNEETPDARE